MNTKEHQRSATLLCSGHTVDHCLCQEYVKPRQEMQVAEDMCLVLHVACCSMGGRNQTANQLFPGVSSANYDGDLPIHDPAWLPSSSSLSLMKLGSSCSKAWFPELEATLTLLMKSCKDKFHFNELHVVKIQIWKWCLRLLQVHWHFLFQFLYCAAFCVFVNSKQILGKYYCR